MPRSYEVTVVQQAAYTAHNLTIEAATPADAARKALDEVASGQHEGRFEHSGSAPGDDLPAYVSGILGGPVPFEFGEIGAQYPAVADLVAAARHVLAPLNATDDEVARGDLRKALQDLTGEPYAAPAVVPALMDWPLHRELVLLRRLVGTQSPEGLAEMRGIADRAARQVEEMGRELAACADALAGAIPHAPRIRDILLPRFEAAQAIADAVQRRSQDTPAASTAL